MNELDQPLPPLAHNTVANRVRQALATLSTREAPEVRRAHRLLLDTIRQSPSDHPLYGPMVQAANWLQPLGRPDMAALALAQGLHKGVA